MRDICDRDRRERLVVGERGRLLVREVGRRQERSAVDERFRSSKSGREISK